MMVPPGPIRYRVPSGADRSHVLAPAAGGGNIHAQIETGSWKVGLRVHHSRRDVAAARLSQNAVDRRTRTFVVQ